MIPRLSRLWVCVLCLARPFLVEASPLESLPPPIIRNDDQLLDAIERTAFEYFRSEADPVTGLIKDRSTPDSKCSIAAVGFGLSAWCIGVDRGYVPREEAATRVRATLATFLNGPQGDSPTGVIGHRGWFYHFLEMGTATRAWKCELSSIDTALFLAGALDASRFFTGSAPVEREIRRMSNALVDRVD